jgi:hypothetical protein
MSMCPVEPDQVLITKSNGEIVLITKIETNPEIITKTSEATASKYLSVLFKYIKKTNAHLL